MYRKPKSVNWEVYRILLVAVLFAAGTLILVVRTYKLQIADAESLKKLAEKQRTMVIHLEARRGMILDRSGERIGRKFGSTFDLCKTQEGDGQKRSGKDAGGNSRNQ